MTINDAKDYFYRQRCQAEDKVSKLTKLPPVEGKGNQAARDRRLSDITWAQAQYAAYQDALDALDKIN